MTKGGKMNEGWYNARPIDRDRYNERPGLEGPFMTKSGKVVYYDPREGAYYDPDSDIYLTYDEWKALDEDLGSQVVNHDFGGIRVVSSQADSDGSYIQVFKGDEQIADGYYDLLAGDFVIDGKSFDSVRDVRNFYAGSTKPRLAVSNEERRMITRKMGTISKKSLGETGRDNTTTYLMVETIDGRPGSNWSLMSYSDHPGNNPIYLRKVLDEHSKRLGWTGYKVITQWRGDIDSTLADAQEKLASDKKWIHSYEMRLNDTVKNLSHAKKIMASGTEVKPANTEARDPHEVIRKFLDKKKSKEARSADLAKNPQKVNQLNNDEPLQETDALSTDEVKNQVTVAVMSSGLPPMLVRKYRQRAANAMSGEELYDVIQDLAKEGVFVAGKTKSRDWNFLLGEGGPVLGQGMSPSARQADIDQSDREYIKQRQFKDKWKKENPGKPWPGYREAGMYESSKSGDSFKSSSEVDAWVETEFGGDFAAALDHAIYMANIGRDTVWNRIIKYLDKKTSGQNLKEYKPGVSTLTRELSFADTAGTQFDIHDPDAEYATIKKIRWPYGIDVSFNDRTRTVRFKTAKMKTVAKILDKHIDFGAISAAEALDLPPELMRETDQKPIMQGSKEHVAKLRDMLAAEVKKNGDDSTYASQIRHAIDAYTMKEAMPTTGTKITITIKGEHVRDLQLPANAKVHHIAQEIRKVPLGISDYEIQNAARELARGGVFRRGSLEIRSQGTTPREMR